ncbi:MAG TPA: diguanylate cyclase, partial [Candidatus Omnitrophota bacterium]|nr:diguanylate cyclase [Candidatus Omnitrophota bacterium]
MPKAEADPRIKVIVFNAPNWSMVNKISGHVAGDRMLKELAQAIRLAAQMNGFGERVFRLRGDEFAVLASDTAAEQIRREAERSFGEHIETGTRNGGSTTVTVSLVGHVGKTYRESNGNDMPKPSALFDTRAVGRPSVTLRERIADQMVRYANLIPGNNRAYITRRQAETDRLTGLGNRRALSRALSSPGAAQAMSVKTYGMRVIMFDVNNFKWVNIFFGREVGDQWLQDVAKAIDEAAKEHRGRVFRWAGDEFVVLAPVDRAQEILARAEQNFSQRVVTWSDPETSQSKTAVVSLTGNIGVTISEADAGLEAKKERRKAQHAVAPDLVLLVVGLLARVLGADMDDAGIQQAGMAGNDLVAVVAMGLWLAVKYGWFNKLKAWFTRNRGTVFRRLGIGIFVIGLMLAKPFAASAQSKYEPSDLKGNTYTTGVWSQEHKIDNTPGDAVRKIARRDHIKGPLWGVNGLVARAKITPAPKNKDHWLSKTAYTLDLGPARTGVPAVTAPVPARWPVVEIFEEPIVASVIDAPADQRPLLEGAAVPATPAPAVISPLMPPAAAALPNSAQLAAGGTTVGGTLYNDVSSLRDPKGSYAQFGTIDVWAKPGRFEFGTTFETDLIGQGGNVTGGTAPVKVRALLSINDHIKAGVRKNFFSNAGNPVSVGVIGSWSKGPVSASPEFWLSKADGNTARLVFLPVVINVKGNSITVTPGLFHADGGIDHQLLVNVTRGSNQYIFEKNFTSPDVFAQTHYTPDTGTDRWWFNRTFKEGNLTFGGYVFWPSLTDMKHRPQGWGIVTSYSFTRKPAVKKALPVVEPPAAPKGPVKPPAPIQQSALLPLAAVLEMIRRRSLRSKPVAQDAVATGRMQRAIRRRIGIGGLVIVSFLASEKIVFAQSKYEAPEIRKDGNVLVYKVGTWSAEHPGSNTLRDAVIKTARQYGIKIRLLDNVGTVADQLGMRSPYPVKAHLEIRINSAWLVPVTHQAKPVDIQKPAPPQALAPIAQPAPLPKISGPVIKAASSPAVYVPTSTIPYQPSRTMNTIADVVLLGLIVGWSLWMRRRTSMPEEPSVTPAVDPLPAALDETPSPGTNRSADQRALPCSAEMKLSNMESTGTLGLSRVRYQQWQEMREVRGRVFMDEDVRKILEVAEAEAFHGVDKKEIMRRISGRFDFRRIHPSRIEAIYAQVALIRQIAHHYQRSVRTRSASVNVLRTGLLLVLVAVSAVAAGFFARVLDADMDHAGAQQAGSSLVGAVLIVWQWLRTHGVRVLPDGRHVYIARLVSRMAREDSPSLVSMDRVMDVLARDHELMVLIRENRLLEPVAQLIARFTEGAHIFRFNESQQKAFVKTFEDKYIRTVSFDRDGSWVVELRVRPVTRRQKWQAFTEPS